jgi:hypothetical protein
VQKQSTGHYGAQQVALEPRADRFLPYPDRILLSGLKRASIEVCKGWISGGDRIAVCRKMANSGEQNYTLMQKYRKNLAKEGCESNF